MGIARVLDLAAERGVDIDQVIAGYAADVAPQAPSHRWVIFPTSAGATVIGGMDRGSFAAYAQFPDDETAAQALLQVSLIPPAPPLDQDPAVLGRAALAVAASWEGHDLTEGRPGSDLPLGSPLDHIGNESGHCLYLYGTPMPQRSLPPTDLQEPRTGYLLAGTPPAGVTVSRAVPWFGQPGGGLLVVLDRVIAYYVDTGLLERFAIPVGDS